MIKEVRGIGPALGHRVPPAARDPLATALRAFASIHPAMFGQVLVMRLFGDHGIFGQICGNDFWS